MTASIYIRLLAPLSLSMIAGHWPTLARYALSEWGRPTSVMLGERVAACPSNVCYLPATNPEGGVLVVAVAEPISGDTIELRGLSLNRKGEAGEINETEVQTLWRVRQLRGESYLGQKPSSLVSLGDLDGDSVSELGAMVFISEGKGSSGIGGEYPAVVVISGATGRQVARVPQSIRSDSIQRENQAAPSLAGAFATEDAAYVWAGAWVEPVSGSAASVAVDAWRIDEAADAWGLLADQGIRAVLEDDIQALCNFNLPRQGGVLAFHGGEEGSLSVLSAVAESQSVRWSDPIALGEAGPARDDDGYPVEVAFASGSGLGSTAGWSASGRFWIFDGGTGAFRNVGSSLSETYRVAVACLPHLTIFARPIRSQDVLAEGAIRIEIMSQAASEPSVVEVPGSEASGSEDWEVGLGESMTWMHDLSGDGVPELVVSAPVKIGFGPLGPAGFWVVDPISGVVLATWDPISSGVTWE